MGKYGSFDVEQLDWSSSVSKDIAKVNPEIVTRINKIFPGKKHKLYRFRCRYGTHIADKFGLKVPTIDGNTVNLSDPSVPKELREDLSYCSLPMGIVMNNSVEVYGEIGNSNETAILGVFASGWLLGILETLEPARSFCIRNVWNISAGLRSAFMLPNINDNASHNRLMLGTGCDSLKPKTIDNHFSLFQNLSHSLNTKWYVDIIFFSKEWFDQENKDPNWLSFYYYLHQYLFRYTAVSRNALTFDFVWHLFANTLNALGSKPDPHVLDIVRHLIKLSIGALPGFAPAMNDIGGPFSYIQQAYMEYYKSQYAPTIIEPQHFYGADARHSIYFSINHQTLLESTPRKRKPDSLITDLVQTKSLINNFKKFFSDKSNYFKGSIINEIIPYTIFDFYHFGDAKYRDIQSNEEIPLTDERFVVYKGKKYPFPRASTFIQNCIKISMSKTIRTLDMMRAS